MGIRETGGIRVLGPFFLVAQYYGIAPAVA